MFIVFEGLDGSGKTTQIALLVERLKLKVPFLTVYEPGYTPLGEKIREVVFEELFDVSPRADSLLFSASRAQLVDKVLKPALKDGTPVISDRYYFSTYAYQGYGMGYSLQGLRTLTEYTIDGVEPDLVVYLQSDPAEALARKNLRNKFDKLALAFYEKVHQGYEEMSQAKNWVTIPSGTVEEVHARILTIIKEFLKKNDLHYR